MLKIYGSMLCPDCVKCREDLDNAAVEYEYLDFASDLRNLKEFLILREGPMFEQIRKSGKIGIPCILLEDGSVKLDWEEFM
jgi:glutaredoxin-related protein